MEELAQPPRPGIRFNGPRFCGALERQLQMTFPEEYRRRARHILQMAQTCQDPRIADSLRVIAADYFDAGQRSSFQEQQQVRPDKDAK
jgi:hypothetical protein